MSDLSGADSDYEGQVFRHLALDGAEVTHAEFRDCVFVGGSFCEATLRGCRFRGCLFRECDLSLVRLQGCSFRNTRFEHSKLVGINWAQADWPVGKPLFPPLGFSDCAISYSAFLGLKLNGATVVKCVARDVDFTDADLTGADCRDTDFADSRFVRTNLTDADFTGATGYVISPTLNTLKRTKFSFPEAIALLRALDIILTE